jgi:RHS repeat-associated protein
VLFCAGAVARAELVTARLSYGGAAGASLNATLGYDGIFLAGASGDGTGSFPLYLDETMVMQLTGSQVRDFRLTFSPPPQYSIVIEGERQNGYTSLSSEVRPVDVSLRVTLIRRETPSTGEIPLGQASPISWTPPKTSGMQGPYIDFCVGRARNGDALPPLRIPLLPRGTSDTLAVDLPDCGYVPSNGGFVLTAPQTTVRLELNAFTGGYFSLQFYAPGGGALFAAYHFEFPLWPANWQVPRQAKIIADKTGLGSTSKNETSLTGFWSSIGMTYAPPYNTWTVEDWHVQSTAPLRIVLGRWDRDFHSGGNIGQWYEAMTITETVEVRNAVSAANDPDFQHDSMTVTTVAKQKHSYKVLERWLTADANEEKHQVIVSDTMTAGKGYAEQTGYGEYSSKVFQHPGSPISISGSETSSGYRQFVQEGNSAKTVYEPWGDVVPSYNYSVGLGYQITATGAMETAINYETDARWVDFQLPRSIVRRLGSRILSNATISYSEEVDNRGTAEITDDLKVIVATRKDYASGNAGDFVRTLIKKYRPDVAVPELQSRPYSIQGANGSKQSFHYEITGPDLLITILSGATSGGNEVSGLTPSKPLDPLRMLQNQSTKTIETFRYGYLVRREIWIYDSGSGTNPVFNSTSPVAWENFAYTTDGRLRLRTSSNNSRYEANWAGTRKTWQRDETGLKTNFGYDTMDRVTAVVQESASGVPVQATTFKYDANHRIRFRRVGPVDSNLLPTGDEQLVAEIRYDWGGRITKRIVPGGATDGSANATGIFFSYSYGNGDRDVTETIPTGTRSTTRYADGRLKLVNGTAVATQESYDYAGFDSLGRHQTVISFSNEVNKRPRTITVDWLGRVAEERVNGSLGSSKPIVTTTHYSSPFVVNGVPDTDKGTRGLLESVRVAEMTGTTPLYLTAERLFEYDEFGALRKTGQNLDASAGLQDASTDRFTTTETKFYRDAAGVWWLVTTTKLPHTDNSSAVYTTARHVRLTGLDADKTAQLDSFDFFNNRTSVEVSFNSAAKTRIVTSLAVDGAKTVTTTVGGLTSSMQSVSDAGIVMQPTTYGYDAQGRLERTTSPRAVVTRHQYHSGTTQVWKTFDGRNEAGQEIRAAMFAYDSAGRVSAATDAKGYTTTTTYYASGQLKDRAGSGTHPVHFEYNAFGQQKELWTYRNGEGGVPDKTLWEYNANTGWLESKKDAADRIVSYTYCYAGPYLVVTRTSPRPGLTTTCKYLLTTGELALVDYTDNTPDVAYAYTRTGKLDTVTEGSMADNTVFPAAFQPGARVRDFAYDREQLSAEALDATWYGGLVLTTLFDNASTQNPSGNLVPGRYAGFALGYVPVVNGVAQTQDLAKELKVAIVSDDFGRPKTFEVSHAGQLSASFGYDYTPNSSFWQKLTRGSYSLERTPEAARDAIKTVTAKWGTTTTLTEHTYTTNDAGERASVVQRGTVFGDYGADNGATSVVYGYNGAGELTAATGYLGTGASQALPGRGFAFTYDTAGNRKTAAIGAEQVGYTDGAGTAGGNNLNQVKQRGTLKTHVSGTASPLATLNVSGATLSRGSEARYWDAVLESWGQFTQVNLTATRNGQTQVEKVWALLRPAQETIVYDEEGNLTGDALWRYEYDAENRLIRMATKSADELAGLGWGSTPPAREITFLYDYLGRRVEKIARKNGAITFSRRFVYDGWNLIAEFELVAGAVKMRRSYAWGLDVASSLTATGGVGALILETVHDGATRTHYNLAADAQANITALLDAGGNPVAAFEYDPFGQPLRSEGAVNGDTVATVNLPDLPGDNPFRYSSKYLDRETGLYYYGHRYYDPNLGRFLNRDPIGEAGGENLYGFVGNNPANRLDYLGLAEPTVGMPEGSRPSYPTGPIGRTPDMPGGEDFHQTGVDLRDSAVPPPPMFGTNGANGEATITAGPRIRNDGHISIYRDGNTEFRTEAQFRNYLRHKYSGIPMEIRIRMADEVGHLPGILLADLQALLTSLIAHPEMMIGPGGMVKSAASSATREAIIARLTQTVDVRVVRSLDSEALVGLRGSLARGFKSAQKGNAPFDPNNFDVDAFIVSNKLAAQFHPDVWWRNAGDVGLDKLQLHLDSTLRNVPEFKGLKADPFTFRIFTTAEIERRQAVGDAQIFFLTR